MIEPLPLTRNRFRAAFFVFIFGALKNAAEYPKARKQISALARRRGEDVRAMFEAMGVIATPLLVAEPRTPLTQDVIQS